MSAVPILKQEQLDREHRRNCMALAESLRVRHRIAPGYGLAPLLGLSSRLDNRKALVEWVRQHTRHTHDSDFKTLSRELRRALDNAFNS